MTTRHTAILTLYAAAIALTGCYGPGTNNSRAIGGSERLYTLYPDTAGPPRPTDVPSVWGYERDNWETTVIYVPSEVVQHQPTFTRNPHLTTNNRRQRGEYPTSSSAFDLPTREDRHDQFVEAWVAPFAAAADVILFLPRLVKGPYVGETVVSPTTPYERSTSDLDDPGLRGEVAP